jgi:hypothetical protein
MSAEEKKKALEQLEAFVRENELQTQNKKEGNSENCFDYYKFGSVTAKFRSDKNTYFSDETVQFTGKITNTNDYPVVNGNLWIQILRSNKQGENENGYNLTGQFLAESDITLAPKESKNITFQYKIPKSFSQDTYYAASFFTIANSYNMAGLTFLSSVWADYTPFNVRGFYQSSVYLDRNSVSQNGEPVKFRSFAKSVKASEDVKIDFKAVNERKTKEEFTIKYQLFKWDTLKPENLIKETQEKITLNPGETKNLSHMIPKLSQGTYQMRIDAQSENVKSMLEIRLTTDQVEQGRINFANVNKFPLRKNDNTTLISCFHNGGQGTFEGTAVLVLKDKEGNILAQKNYVGQISPDFSAIKADFQTKKDLSYVTLTAVLKDKNGKLMDEVTTTYDFRTPEEKQELASGAKKTRNILLTVAIFLILAGIAYLSWKKYKRSKYIFPMIAVMIGVAVVMFFETSTAKAQAYYATFDASEPGNPHGYRMNITGNPQLDKDNLFYVVHPDGSYYFASSYASVSIGDRIVPVWWLVKGEWFDIGGTHDSPAYNTCDIKSVQFVCQRGPGYCGEGGDEYWIPLSMCGSINMDALGVSPDQPSLLTDCGSDGLRHCFWASRAGRVNFTLSPWFHTSHSVEYYPNYYQYCPFPGWCSPPIYYAPWISGNPDAWFSGPQEQFIVDIVDPN